MSKKSQTTNGNGAAGYVAPVWFISHGGPPTMFDPSHPAYAEWEKFGQEIRKEHNDGNGGLKGLIAISAHWQSTIAGVLEVNTNERNPLYYDFFGFPDHYYTVKVKSHNPSAFSTLVLSELNHALSTQSNPSLSLHKAVPTSRGLDHGAFVPLKVAFAPSSLEASNGGWSELKSAKVVSALPSTLPLLQVSLPPSDDPEASLRLGVALRTLRTQHGIGIFASGMAVHNLRELFLYLDIESAAGQNSSPSRDKGVYASYAKSFAEALGNAVGAEPKAKQAQVGNEAARDVDEDSRWQAAKDLLNRSDYKKAHPTAEHLLPVFVALGAVKSHERFAQTFKLPEGSMAW
ncbi:LigB subunit of an aromatic-ring-opening dioxygenase LigAB [Tilletiaria anomala UBC 951]|uniref:LigB subunit of an aromatic-ring-opening dioxygenase LigAB n=1 Tax=Tilletiaria anomala (strain ATCC 24038 / CBS 436.72 / UBC 951) TaxID=1037660 RepID=A0A066WK04_TILAU|nr:LigB subunit of an aromatic-ring-opening dioxygenase LigAB [Tilletiaria anomala UBC 951]KDN52883.1 LigB subunit of an aromatic-ring-opening dioxygenase LigAB [Tilletiaria anomala UBC 951]